MIPIMRPIINQEMLDAATASLQNEKLVLGESVYTFEKKFAEYTGTKYAVSTNSGTMALMLALKAAGVSQGDKVLTSTMSFIATANSIVHNNAIPVFGDINPSSGNIAASSIAVKNEKVILPVHLYGNISDVDSLRKIKEEHNMIMVEDAAQAHGATHKGKKAGSLGDMGCFSFYSTKNMTVGGDGGIITTDNEEYVKLIRKYTDCGRKSKYEHDVVGYTARLNTVNAAIALVQLKYLDQWNERRKEIAKIYSARIPKEIQLSYGEGCVYYTYTIKTPKKEQVSQHLKENDIQTGVYFPLPQHLQPIYKEMFGYRGGEFPLAEQFSQEILSLPMFAGMTDEQANFVAEKVTEAVKK